MNFNLRQNLYLGKLNLGILLTLVFVHLLVSLKAQPDQRLMAGLTIENLGNYAAGFDERCNPLPKSDEQKEFVRLLERLNLLPVKPVLRIVFQGETKSQIYKCALKELKKRNYKIMGLFLDSYALSSYRIKRNPADPDYDSNESETDKSKPIEQRLHDYKRRIDDYLAALNDEVDIWEVGNEVNGEWVDENCNPDPAKKEGSDNACRNQQATDDSFDATIAKINYAIEKVAEKNAENRLNKETALTLVYQPGCVEWTGNAMFRWFERAKPKLDLARVNYLLVSYYENDKCDKKGRNTICNKDFIKASHDQPERDFCSADLEKQKMDDPARRQIFWSSFFNHLKSQVSQPNIKLGFGEVGCRNNDGCASKIGILKRYYSIRAMDPRDPKLQQSWFVGGYFWWTAQQDLLKSDTFTFELRQIFSKF